MKYLILNIIAICLLANMASAQCSGPMSIVDSLELVEFYDHFDGDNWSNNEGWLVDPVSEWVGISIGEVGDSCYVVAIEINGFNFGLNASFNGDLYDFDFPYNEILIISSASITGEIVDFSKMPNLTFLQLTTNPDLGGMLP